MLCFKYDGGLCLPSPQFGVSRILFVSFITFLDLSASVSYPQFDRLSFVGSLDFVASSLFSVDFLQTVVVVFRYVTFATSYICSHCAFRLSLRLAWLPLLFVSPKSVFSNCSFAQALLTKLMSL
ncbi:hypothetical protein TSUD_286650 [Trifolium subterraneum]|uniref:Uncharacterized protein n=1 Tax=Trifolium subterraneum TaxID=3900 RepID=A0A2Z6MEN3_TRISU|nr:hypothetical protein TSUD_286650 [Trifolium subterraneum]